MTGLSVAVSAGIHTCIAEVGRHDQYIITLTLQSQSDVNGTSISFMTLQLGVQKWTKSIESKGTCAWISTICPFVVNFW